jgi:AcrR family transcriptional regulator
VTRDEKPEVRRLPAGAHGISADLVARNQRERLVAAVAEACAERGYAEISVTDLTQRAGVSTATFYKLFPGKLECTLEAHRELLERLLEEVDQACGAESRWEDKVRAAIHVALTLLAADLPTARLLTVEIMALGREDAERSDAAIEAFATRLRAGRSPSDAGQAFSNADWALVAGIAMLIGRCVMAGEASGLPEIEDELVAMLVAGHVRQAPHRSINLSA